MSDAGRVASAPNVATSKGDVAGHIGFILLAGPCTIRALAKRTPSSSGLKQQTRRLTIQFADRALIKLIGIATKQLAQAKRVQDATAPAKHCTFTILGRLGPISLDVD
jgi:hypothetical protein